MAVPDVPIPFNPILEKEVLRSVAGIVHQAHELVDTKVRTDA
jgi:hypothetical protein